MSPFNYLKTVILAIEYHLFTLTFSQSLFPISHPSQPFNWFEANIACNNSMPRGQLASTHNTSYDTLLNTECAATTYDTCWIGLYITRTANNPTWKWIDNTATNHYQFNDNYPTNPTPHNIQSCVSISTQFNDPITWNNDDCADKLSAAVCMTCGGLGEYCCGTDNQCNDNHLECIANMCSFSPSPDAPTIHSMNVTRIDLMKHDTINENKIKLPRQYDQTHGIEIATVAVFLFMFCAVMLSCVDRKKKKKGKEKKTKEQLEAGLTSKEPQTQMNITKERERVYSA